MNRITKPSYPENPQDKFQIDDFRQYYPLGCTPEILWFIEQEYWQGDRTNRQPTRQPTQRDCSTSNNHTSTTEIIIALGFITTLLCFAGVQLHRSINIEPAQAQKQTEQVFPFRPLENLRKISFKQLAWRI